MYNFKDSLDFNDGDGSAFLLISALLLSLLSHLEAFLALSPLRLFDYSRLEDAVTGSTIDARAPRGSHHGLTRVDGQRDYAGIVGNLRGEVDRVPENRGGEKPVKSLLPKLLDINCIQLIWGQCIFPIALEAICR